uniref:Uncharacterized protein n=1 Tax=Timema monikensis TaxID=170555 RepID=A0A7R9HQQ3_9NEOP|nr:unnamed protein product [Timema monikensis]
MVSRKLLTSSSSDSEDEDIIYNDDSADDCHLFSDEENDAECLYCTGLYSEDHNGEDWVRCIAYETVAAAFIESGFKSIQWKEYHAGLWFIPVFVNLGVTACFAYSCEVASRVLDPAASVADYGPPEVARDVCFY